MQMKGYKAYKKGLVCKGFQYEEGKIFKTDKAICCSTGFHFCENPLDTLNYYDYANLNLQKLKRWEI
jgi:hypothetical protein